MKKNTTGRKSHGQEKDGSRSKRQGDGRNHSRKNPLQKEMGQVEYDKRVKWLNDLPRSMGHIPPHLTAVGATIYPVGANKIVMWNKPISSWVNSIPLEKRTENRVAIITPMQEIPSAGKFLVMLSLSSCCKVKLLGKVRNGEPKPNGKTRRDERFKDGFFSIGKKYFYIGTSPSRSGKFYLIMKPVSEILDDGTELAPVRPRKNDDQKFWNEPEVRPASPFGALGTTDEKNTAKPEKPNTPSPAKREAKPSISIKERTAEHITFGCSFKKVAGRLNPILKGIGKCLSPEDLKVVEKCLSRQLFEVCSANGTNGTVKVFLKKGKKLIEQEERIREAAEARVKKAIDLFSDSKTRLPDNGGNGNGNGNGNGKKNKANHHHSDYTMKDLKKMRNGGGARATK